MRKYLFFIVLFFAYTYSYAQQYKVYSVAGNVTVDGKSVVAKQILTSKSILSISKGGRIILFDSSSNKLTTLKNEGKGNVASHLKIAGNSEKIISGSYLSFIAQKMTSEDKKGSTYMQTAGSAYRDTDNLFRDSISKDSLNSIK
ncbi:MAG: hypothetical protein J6W24_06800 [Prevotella sp.]|nr:hypothetical protein [Prevotella sp.]